MEHTFPMTLGRLITALKQFDPDDGLVLDFLDFVPGSLSSYRGYYDQLAVEPVNSGNTTVGQFLSECEAAVGKTFTGWKGGDYTMDEDTRVWVSEHGRAHSTAVVGVRQVGVRVVLDTAYLDW